MTDHVRHAPVEGHLDGVGIYILMRSCSLNMGDRLARVLAPHGISVLGYLAMVSIRNLEGNLTNPSDLGVAIGESRGNITRVCDELVRGGWLSRKHSTDDRRRVDLSLTAAGITMLDELTPTLGRKISVLQRRRLGKEQAAALRSMLAGLHATLAGAPEPGE